MKYFITVFQTTKDGNRIFHRRLIHQYLLETTFQCRILLNILTVLIKSGRTDTMQFPSCKQRFQHITRIHGAICLACANDQMKLIDKQNNLSFALSDLFQNCFQTLFKFTSVFGSCHQSTHIQRENLLILQSFRYITTDDTLCQTFYNGCLTNTRFTDQHRIVLGLTGQNTDHIPDLRITPDHRIKLLLSGTLYQLRTIFIQSIISCFWIVTGHTLITADTGQCFQKTIFGNTVFPEQILHGRTRIVQQ